MATIVTIIGSAVTASSLIAAWYIGRPLRAEDRRRTPDVYL